MSLGYQSVFMSGCLHVLKLIDKTLKKEIYVWEHPDYPSSLYFREIGKQYDSNNDYYSYLVPSPIEELEYDVKREFNRIINELEKP